MPSGWAAATAFGSTSQKSRTRTVIPRVATVTPSFGPSQATASAEATAAPRMFTTLLPRRIVTRSREVERSSSRAADAAGPGSCSSLSSSGPRRRRSAVSLPEKKAEPTRHARIRAMDSKASSSQPYD